MSNITQITSFLRAVPLFRGLNNHQLEHLAKRMVEREYTSGQTIVSQGQGGEGIFIITEGSVTVQHENASGEKTEVNLFKPTDFFGELALLDDGPRTASVIALEASKCFVLTRWDFLTVLRENDAEMAINILQELAKRFRRALDAL